MQCKVIDFEMHSPNDNTYKDRFFSNDSDAKGTLEFLGERVYIEMKVTQKDMGSFSGGTIRFSSGDYEGGVLADFMGNVGITINKGDKVIFRYHDRYWRFDGDDLDDVTRYRKITNPAVDWIRKCYGGFIYSTLSYAEDYSKKCPDVRWAIYNTCMDEWVDIKWTVTNLNRTAEDDGYECDAVAYFESCGQKKESGDSEPLFHLVTLDSEPIKDTKVFYGGELMQNIEGPAFDLLCETFYNYICLCNIGYGE